MSRPFATSSFSPLKHETDLHLHISTISTVISRSKTTNYGNDRILIPAYRGIGKQGVPIRRRNNNSMVIAATTRDSAASVVRKFYEGINCHDLASVEHLIAHNCIYEDLVFPRPFVGRKAILDFFKKFTDSISTDLQFAIDDMSEDDTSAVGVIWHLEWKGKVFPFSKGCSFYRLDVINGKRQIVDVVRNKTVMEETVWKLLSSLGRQLWLVSE